MPNSLDALRALATGDLNARNPEGLVQSAVRRKGLIDELKRNMEIADFGNAHGVPSVTGATNSDIASLEDDAASDSQTGTDAQDFADSQQQKYQAGVDYNRPDVTQRRNEDIATKKMLAIAPTEAAGANQLALDKQRAGEDAAQREATMKAFGLTGGGSGAPGGMPAGSQKTVHIGADGNPTMSITPPKPMGQLEQRAITSFHEAQPILDQLDRELGHPNSGLLSQALSKGSNMGHKFLYDNGIGTDDQTKQGLEGLLAVLGSSSYVVGSRSYQLIKQAMAHLTNGNGSDAFNKHQIDTMRALWPQMEAEVEAAHIGTPLTPPGAANDPAGIR